MADPVDLGCDPRKRELEVRWGKFPRRVRVPLQQGLARLRNLHIGKRASGADQRFIDRKHNDGRMCAAEMAAFLDDHRLGRQRTLTALTRLTALAAEGIMGRLSRPTGQHHEDSAA